MNSVVKHLNPLSSGRSIKDHLNPSGEKGDFLDLFGTKAKKAADKAANYVTQAAQAAADEQKRQSDINQANQAPWLQAGQQALQQQQALSGALGPAAQQAAIAAMNPSPGQQFMQQQQEKKLMADASRTGNLGGGNIRSDLLKQAILESMNNFNTDYNRMAGISGTGQVAGQNLGQLGQQSAMNLSQNAMDAGNARASGILGAAQSQAQSMGNAAGMLGTAYGAYRNNQTPMYSQNVGGNSAFGTYSPNTVSSSQAMQVLGG